MDGLAVVGKQNADIADTLQLRNVAMTTIFWGFYMWDAHWHHLANTSEPSVCGGDVALCQVTLTTYYYCCYACAVRRTLKSGLTQDELAVVLAAK